MIGIQASEVPDWDGQLLADLPQFTIPDTTTGIARANVDYEAYAPTDVLRAPIVPVAVQKSPSFFDSLLGDVSKVLGAAHLDVEASGAGVSVVRLPQAGSTIINTTKTPNFFVANPLLSLALLGGVVWLLAREA